MVNKQQVMKKLAEVIDPELHISIVDLGLVYKTELKKNSAGWRIKIVMTLTTMGCPLFSLIERDAKNKLQELGLKDEDIELELTFDPPWSMEKLSEKAKATLGI